MERLQRKGKIIQEMINTNQMMEQNFLKVKFLIQLQSLL